jgi:hypothetical protein
MFKVQAKGVSQEFDRWVDALETAKSLQSKCGWFDEVRIVEKGELVWVYSRGYKYPRFIGPGVYDRLARRFILESTVTDGAIDTTPAMPTTPTAREAELNAREAELNAREALLNERDKTDTDSLEKKREPES